LRRVESQQYTDLDMKILQQELESSDSSEKTSDEESEPKKKPRKKSEPADTKTETTVQSDDEKPADSADIKLD
jgi:hypothetical protein